jgi:16S rRNA (cytidine1402-2'-O)-methyltransferase
LVEDEKSARRLVKLLCPERNIRELDMRRLDEHTKPSEIPALMEPLTQGIDMGVISEAGVPAVADPGSTAVRFAHAAGARVVPLVGPCSMVLALMASGLNGQRWRFLGYVPVDDRPRRDAIRAMERDALRGETQIFMDTPYRNQRLLSEVLETCKPDTRLCVAAGLTTEQESVRTKTIAEWRAGGFVVEKIPALFLIGI